VQGMECTHRWWGRHHSLLPVALLAGAGMAGMGVVKRIEIGKRVGGFELTSQPSGTLSHATD